MQAKSMIPILLLYALAGCAGSAGPAGTPASRAAAPAPAPSSSPPQPQENPRGPQQQPASGTAWHAFGNEPFWSVQARGGTLVFTTPDDQEGVTLSGRRVPSLVGTVILGSGPKGEFHLGVTPGDCSDGMSDRTHAFHSTFIYGGTTYQGCAEPVDAR